MPNEAKRKHPGQLVPVSTRRKAKKARLAEELSNKDPNTLSKKAQRKLSQSGKPKKQAADSDDDEDSDQDVEESQDEEEEEAPARPATTVHSQQSRSEDSEDEDDDEELGPEPIGKGKKGFKRKVKKPSGKKGKVFADTNAMLNIINQVAGTEEARIKRKQSNMAKVKTKVNERESKLADRVKAKKTMIENKIEELKRKKSEKRKEHKQQLAEKATKADAAPGKRSVRFQL